jgi:hypothetical protein
MLCVVFNCHDQRHPKTQRCRGTNRDTPAQFLNLEDPEVSWGIHRSCHSHVVMSSCHSHGKAVLFIDGAYNLNDCLYDSAVLWRWCRRKVVGRFQRMSDRMTKSDQKRTIWNLKYLKIKRPDSARCGASNIFWGSTLHIFAGAGETKIDELTGPVQSGGSESLGAA